MTIGKRIVKFRKEHKISQETLSEKLGITRQTLSNYENDITSPEIETANKIAKTLNISLDELLGNDLSFIESKLKDNEKINKNNSKLLKILLITTYFIILISLIIITIYFITKKDLTQKYQLGMICSKELSDAIDYEFVRVDITEENYYCMVDLEEICVKGVCELNLCPNDKRFFYYNIKIDTLRKYNYGEEIRGTGNVLGGYSLKDAYESLLIYKENLINNGYKCKKVLDD